MSLGFSDIQAFLKRLCAVLIKNTLFGLQKFYV
jgi:hypothetical protein